MRGALLGAAVLAALVLFSGDQQAPAGMRSSLVMDVAAAGSPTAGGYAVSAFMTSPAFNQIVDLAVMPGNAGEAVVITQKDARLWRISLADAFSPTLYGDLSAIVGGSGSEEGLLSLAFSPNFASDGRLYVYSTRGSPQPSVLSRFQASTTAVDAGSEVVVLEAPQPFSNHNGGRLLFGPDGHLYLSLGDGGSGGDPLETGQDNTDLLGSLLRLKVTGEATYAAPPDNPFVGQAGADEVWAFGLRNPWRYSFDRLSGDLWLADVGQGAWEEVGKIVAGGNYGWDCYEGFASYEPAGCQGVFQFPRAVYGHSQGCAVTGGYVYRGAALPDLYGWYVYGDFCSGRIWAVDPNGAGDPVLLVDTTLNIASFSELSDGELLLLSFDNTIYRLGCNQEMDADGDGQGDACDRCPAVATTWVVPAGDGDCDGWTDADEGLIGTSPGSRCGGAGSWPANINNDGPSANQVDIFDVNRLRPPVFFSAAPGPPYQPRLDLNPNGVIDVFDVNRMAPPVFFATCVP
ncbi:MAG: PQQ-dependent sugar dehydrogenase [Chloroflexi bacterium]|nr:PQQ-dependent sugar dehydrogenase [Chloroflexota bacterium]